MYTSKLYILSILPFNSGPLVSLLLRITAVQVAATECELVHGRPPRYKSDIHVILLLRILAMGLNNWPQWRQMHQLENAEHCGGEPEQAASWVWHRIGHEQVDMYLDKPSPGITYANCQESGNIPSLTQQASKQESKHTHVLNVVLCSSFCSYPDIT